MLDNVPDLVVRFDQGFRVVYANPAVRLATGSLPEACVNKRVAEMGLTADVLACWEPALCRAFAEGLEQRFEMRCDVDGVVRYFQAHVVPELAADGEVVTALMTACDVSELVWTEMILRESEARLFALTANIPGMVFQLLWQQRDDTFQFLYASEGAFAISSRDAGPVFQDAPRLISLIVEEDRARFFQAMAVSAERALPVVWEGRVQVFPDQPLWLQLKAMPRHMGEQQVLWEGIMLNVTEDKQRELDLVRSRQLLRDLAAYHESAMEQERKRIAREIHDDLGQMLTAVKMELSLLEAGLPATNTLLRGKTAHLKDLVQETMQRVRDVASNLRPTVLELGFVAAVEWLVQNFQRRVGISCHLMVPGDDLVLDDAVATHLFRMLQEALTNVARHADAGEVDILLERRHDRLCLAISDNGRGFDLEAVKGRRAFGLLGMRERVLVLGGELEIETGLGQGTALTIFIPCNAGES